MSLKSFGLGLVLVGTVSLGHALMYDITDQYKAGAHVGEVKQLTVDATFSGAFGSTTTDASGIHYSFYGITISEDKVYPSQYWGTVPLYFFGTRVGATVTVTNNGPRATTKLLITTQVFGINTDGSNGARLAPDRVTEITVAKGETKVIDASFVPEYVPGADSGLDRVIILVQHPNQGGGPGNPYPALIMAKEAILCPPDVEARAKAGR